MLLLFSKIIFFVINVPKSSSDPVMTEKFGGVWIIRAAWEPIWEVHLNRSSVVLIEIFSGHHSFSTSVTYTICGSARSSLFFT